MNTKDKKINRLMFKLKNRKIKKLEAKLNEIKGYVETLRECPFDVDMDNIIKDLDKILK